MSETTSVQVNFGKPFPLFPLNSVTLMPHALLRLFVFEPRYRQMVEDVLDGAGQIAMGVFRGEDWMEEYEGSPPVKPVVCIGQVAQHQKLADGTYHLWLHGVCRARIVEELEPDDSRLYRLVTVRPIESGEPDEEALAPHRERLIGLLGSAPLSGLKSSKAMLEELQAKEELPTGALLEAISLGVLSTLNDQSLQYRLLEEGDAEKRAHIIERELVKLAKLLKVVELQHDPDAPRGVSWN